MKMVKEFLSDGKLTNYIYCSVYDFLIFIPENLIGNYLYRNSHLKRCITRNTISKEIFR